MSKSTTISVVAKRGCKGMYPWSNNDTQMKLYGTEKQYKKGEDFLSFCYTTWMRKTGIKIEPGEAKRVDITFTETG